MESPNTSKLPVIERKVDHLNTIVTALCVTVFLPIPLLLAFGPKAFLWMGVVVCIVAVVRLINSPVQLERRPAPASDPVTAAARAKKAPGEIGVNSPSSTSLR